VRPPHHRGRDRVPGVVDWNLFDIDSKFGDVEPLERVVSYLDELAPAAGEELQGSSAPISA
jgi:N-carbamoylsarcosine amidase